MTKREIIKYIENEGGILTRKKKHLIFKFPGGIRGLTVSKTPRCWEKEYLEIKKYIRKNKVTYAI